MTNNRIAAQIREQMSRPDLYVFTLKFLSLKKPGLSLQKTLSNVFWPLFTFILCNFSVWTLNYFQKSLKNGPQKLLIIGPNPSTVQPRPQPKIDFLYYEISGPDICSLICDYQRGSKKYWLPYFWPKARLWPFEISAFLLTKKWCSIVW